MPLAHQLKVLAAMALGAAAMLVVPLLGGSFLPEFREGILIAEVSAWPGTSSDMRLARAILPQFW